MSNIIWLRRRIASPLVIAKLVELGYLKQAKRDNARAVENAIVRMRQCQESRDRAPGSAEECAMSAVDDRRRLIGDELPGSSLAHPYREIAIVNVHDRPRH